MAAWAGYDNDWWASLIMPMAGVARLGSYVAMFLVLRPAIPVLAHGRQDARPAASTFRDRHRAVLRDLPRLADVPGGLARVRGRALDYRIGDAMTVAAGERVTELHPGSLPVGASTWVLIAAALVTRTVLSWLKDRLPAWMRAGAASTSMRSGCSWS